MRTRMTSQPRKKERAERKAREGALELGRYRGLEEGVHEGWEFLLHRFPAAAAALRKEFPQIYRYDKGEKS